jgi:REP element-mobilizing transposase RayT
MPHTFSKLLHHLVFATKYRAPLIAPEIQDGLYRRVHQIVETQGADIIEIGGMPDHIHLLLEARPRISLASLVQQVKGGSSHWLQEHGKAPGEAFWQSGYGVFSVSESNLKRIRQYIRDQPIHHQNRSSRGELILLLRKHRIPFHPAQLDD